MSDYGRRRQSGTRQQQQQGKQVPRFPKPVLQQRRQKRTLRLLRMQCTVRKKRTWRSDTVQQKRKKNGTAKLLRTLQPLLPRQKSRRAMKVEQRAARKTVPKMEVRMARMERVTKQAKRVVAK